MTEDKKKVEEETKPQVQEDTVSVEEMEPAAEQTPEEDKPKQAEKEVIEEGVDSKTEKKTERTEEPEQDKDDSAESAIAELKTALVNTIAGLEDFELIAFLVIMDDSKLGDNT